MDKWEQSVDEQLAAEEEFANKVARIGSEAFKSEYKKHPELYSTERQYKKGLEYYKNEYAYDIAAKKYPQLLEKTFKADASWENYIEECRKVSDSIIGKHGNEAIPNTTNKRVRDMIGDIVVSMDSEGMLVK